MSEESQRIPASEYFSTPGLQLLYETKDLKDHNREVVGISSSDLFICHFVKKDPSKSSFSPVSIENVRYATVKTSFRLMKFIIGLILLVFGIGWIILFVEGVVEVIFYWVAGLSALAGFITLLSPFEHHASFVLEDNDETLKSSELSWKSKRKLARFMKEKRRLA